MTQDIKHTPLPWVERYSQFDDCWHVAPTDEGMGEECGFGEWTEIAQCRLNEGDNSDEDGEFDAKFIVTACNAYYDHIETIAVMKEALERILKQVSISQASESEKIEAKYVPTVAWLGLGHIKDAATEALAKVKP